MLQSSIFNSEYITKKSLRATFLNNREVKVKKVDHLECVDTT